jgi:hypothetical protein
MMRARLQPVPRVLVLGPAGPSTKPPCARVHPQARAVDRVSWGSLAKLCWDLGRLAKLDYEYFTLTHTSATATVG